MCFLTINRGKGIKKLFSVSEITSGTVPVVTGHTHKSASQEELIHFPQNLDFFPKTLFTEKQIGLSKSSFDVPVCCTRI